MLSRLSHITTLGALVNIRSLVSPITTPGHCLPAITQSPITTLWRASFVPSLLSPLPHQDSPPLCCPCVTHYRNRSLIIRAGFCHPSSHQGLLCAVILLSTLTSSELGSFVLSLRSYHRIWPSSFVLSFCARCNIETRVICSHFVTLPTSGHGSLALSSLSHTTSGHPYFVLSLQSSITTPAH